MGCHPNVTAEKFPKQSENVGRMATVVFNYDASRKIKGKVLRDDREEPFRTIILLDDGRVVLTTECQWQPEALALDGVRSGRA